MQPSRLLTGPLHALLALPLVLAGLPLLAEERDGGQSVPLECRLAGGPWQHCRMRVERVGEHWFLLVGGQQFEFHHDGTGQVTMQQGAGARRSVSATWQADASLCWDGVCARGPIPLD